MDFSPIHRIAGEPGSLCGVWDASGVGKGHLMLMEADGFCPGCYCEWVRYRLGYSPASHHPLTEALAVFPEGYAMISKLA